MANSRHDPTKTELQTESLMIVEDNPANLRILANILTEQKYRIRLAVNGKLAMASLELDLPDMILLDVCLPDINGYELCKKLKDDPRTREIPVIFISALDESTDKLKAFEAGGIDYITKPFQDEEVLARIRTHLTIGRLRKQLLNMNKELERKVSERTASLVRANTALKDEIEKRKEAENESIRLRNYLKNIFDSMPSILVGVDREGIITHWNMAAERGTGCPADQAEGKPVAEIFPLLTGEMDKVHTAISKRRIQRDEKVLTWEQGERRFSDITVYPLVTNGVEGAAIRIDNVTERVEMEEMMIQSEKMLSVGGLAAGMAHEINNPLAGIIQNTNVLSNRLTGDLPVNRRTAEECGITFDNIRHYIDKRGIPAMLDSIVQSGTRAADIVKTILSFSRKSTTETLLQPIVPLLDNTVELVANDYNLSKKYDFRKIEIIREYAPAVPDINCDKSKIQLVFLNILKNGAQAMAGSEKKEEPPRFILRVAHDGPMVRIEIEDNGPGMDEKTRKRIFEPFFTTKSRGEGTGLGMSLAYFIITENHGGKMTVESRPGKGSKFTILLPVPAQKETSETREKDI